MTFEQLVDRLLTLFDVDQARVVDVANERLQRFCTEAEFIRAIVALGTTTAGTASYTLAANVTKILKANVAYSAGEVVYDGNVTLEELWAVDAGMARVEGGARLIAIEPDADSSGVTDNFRLYPAPGESGKTVNGYVVLQPATLTYASGTALPIPLDTHQHLLAGCKAELYDEEDRQDESAKMESVFAAGVAKLHARVTGRGKGSGSHRPRVSGYDFRR